MGERGENKIRRVPFQIMLKTSKADTLLLHRDTLG